MDSPPRNIKLQVIQRIHQAPASKVWTAVDFCDLGGRDGVDKTLQRLVASKDLRRVDRGLYDRPRTNRLTGRQTAPDYRSVIDAVGRRDQVRVLIDGMTAANDLGLSDAVPGQVIVHTDGRLRPITLDKLTLHFKLTAPSKLYWVNHPAMRMVQALYWLRDSLKNGAKVDQDQIQDKLVRILRAPNQGSAIQDDLRAGMHTVPTWMRQWIGALLVRSAPSSAAAKS